MAFIDENCVIFDNDEENKFVYSEKHHEFCHLIDNLLGAHLSEVGVSEEQFAKVIEFGYQKRDINRKVFDQIIACDDFLTFKKMMVKRNIQLELEVVQAMQNSRKHLGQSGAQKQFQEGRKYDESSQQYEGKNCSTNLETVSESNVELGKEEATQLKAAMEANLIEMQVYAKQMELEQAELEKALAISLKLEEERLYRLKEMKEQQETTELLNKTEGLSKLKVSIKDESAGDPVLREEQKKQETDGLGAGSSGSKHTIFKKSNVGSLGAENSENIKADVGHDFTKCQKELKPIVPGRNCESMKRLRSDDLIALNKMPSLSEFQRRKDAALTEFKKNKEELEKRKADQDELERQSNFTQNEIERRAAYLRKQREILLLKKKTERERKLRDYEGKRRHDSPSQKEAFLQSNQKLKGIKRDGLAKKKVDGNPGNVDSEAQKKRRQMAMQLGLQMKKEMLDEEDSKNSLRQVEQFSVLDEQLRQAEKMRQERRQQHSDQLDRIRQDKLIRAMNIQSSSFANRVMHSSDEFSFKEQ